MQSWRKLLEVPPKVLGILNLTPDSFSDGGKHFSPEAALEHALRMQEEGADGIDVGAESTRPGAREVSAEEQLKRLKFFFEKILPQLEIPVSLDTRHAQIAQEGLKAGVQILNDVSGLNFQPEAMLKILKQSDCAYVLMHSRGKPETMQQLCDYENLLTDISFFFEDKLRMFDAEGISRERIILDPGFGFAKNSSQNVQLLAGLGAFQSFGRPLMAGLSRKSFLRELFGEEGKRRGTELAHWISLEKGTQILRVHEVKSAKQTVRFFQEFL